MLDVPSRESLTALTEAVLAFVPTEAFISLGLARRLDDGSVSMVYAHGNGMGEYVLPPGDAPDVLTASVDGPVQADVTELTASHTGAIGWMWRGAGIKRVASVPLNLEGRVRLWVDLSDPAPLTDGQLARLGELARSSGSDATRSPTPDVQERLERLQRLELVADFLPALLHVLDVREVFDRLSEIAKRALPHDLLLLRLFTDDMTKVTIHARSDRGSQVTAVPNVYPPSVTSVWLFDIVDDLRLHRLESTSPPVSFGLRSTLRLPIKYDNRVIGGVGFLSFQTKKFTTADVPVARRLADHVAMALSHHQLAEEYAEQARHAEELRSQQTNIELLDQLLAALIDAGDLHEVFGRVSEIAGKVLPHDAAVLMVRLPDGVHARVYASAGVTVPMPEVSEIPDDLLQNPDWDYHLFDELATHPSPRYSTLADKGVHSLLRVPIRLEGRFAGALVFSSKSAAAFKVSHVPVARRIADRLAVTLAHDRELEASKRADEATERAARLEARVRALTEELDSRTGYRRIVGESAEWRQVLTQATQVAATDTTVLLLGESGTGKEVVARFLHRASTREGGPFIALNCAAVPEQLLEAELFGFERGAFTGATQSKPGQLELAGGGTLFLDEVGEMSPQAQAKFLRVLQEREFQRLGGTRVLRTSARIVAATNRDLPKAIVNGQFREDLYYRLNVFAIRLPALRHRRDDVLPLSEAFLIEIGRGLGRPPGGISREARQLLIEYHWPGNVRELRNILERAAILCDGGLITREHLALTTVPGPLAVASPVASVAAASAPSAARSAAVESPLPVAPPSSNLQTMERTMIEQALQAHRFNKSKAAKALGLTRHQLYIRMRKHGLE
jgi:transcriptional regulator with GAF, ATPase, and Fis domain